MTAVQQDPPPHVAARQRYEFYRDGFRRMLGNNRWMAVAVGLNTMFSAALLFVINQDHYFAVDPDGRSIPIIPVDQPFVTTADVLTFSASSMAQLNTYDYVNYKQQLNALEPLFVSTQAFNSYSEALVDSKQLQKVVRDNAVSTGVPCSAPVPKQQGLDQNGRYTWIVEVPLTVRLSSGSGPGKQDGLYEVTLQRVPRAERARGFGILSIRGINASGNMC